MNFKEPGSNVLSRQKHSERSLVLRTVKPWNGIQIGEEDGEFWETLLDSF